MKIHFVKAGETLYEIGKKYGVTVEQLVAANKTIIDPNLIMIGMKIIIPEKQMPMSVHEPVQQSMQEPIPADIITPSIPHYPVNQPTTPQQTMPAQQTMPINQTMPAQQTMPINQTMPAQQTMPLNQMYPNVSAQQKPVYPHQTVLPFAAFPVPAQQVTAPIEVSNIPAWSMPTNYTSYNTPYHTTNYSMPYAINPNPNPKLNSTPDSNSYPSYQGMVQPNSHYEPYAENAMPYYSTGNYEYYNTYHSLNYNEPWSSHNSQPHAQMQELQSTHNPKKNLASTENKSNVEISPQQAKEKARTSSTSNTTKQTLPIKSKKHTLHDQVMRLHQTRNRR